MRTLLPLALLTGCYSTPSDDPVVVFDTVWEDFDAFYGGFHQRDVDWDQAYSDWRPTIDESSDEDALYDALGGLLGTLDDGHVKMVAPDRDVFHSSAVYREHRMEGTFDEEVVRTYLTDIDTGPWDWYLRGELAPGVAYLWLPGIDDNTHVLDTIVDAGPDALIIDLRHSHGGAFTFALHGMGRLTAEDLPVFRCRSRVGPDRDADYSDWTEWTFPARGPHWSGPIYVLVDGETISASERVLMFLQALPNTTTIGVTTNGALATSVGREMPNGWGYQIPVQEVEGLDGSVPEGTGLPVDIEMLNDPADVAAGRDAMLEHALELALGG